MDKKKIIKKVCKLRAIDDQMWAALKSRHQEISRLMEKEEPFTESETIFVKLCLGVIATKLIVNTIDVAASLHITPEDIEDNESDS